MQKFKTILTTAVRDPDLRRRILFVLAMLIVFRLLAAIPVPGIDAAKFASFLQGNQLLGLLNVFSGGGLSKLSIVMLGVGPYITATIVMQLLTLLSPKLKALYHEEGDSGRKRFSMYSRYLTVPLAFIQGAGFMLLLEKEGILPHLSYLQLIFNLFTITAGSLILMWLGELISEFGIGNGVSLIIFGGIVATIPNELSQVLYAFDPTQVPYYIGFLLASAAMVLAVVVVSEAERPVPVTYARQVRGNKVYGGVSTYLPLRLNQAGVIPIIFALSILLFPQMILGFLANISGHVGSISQLLLTWLENNYIYASLYFLLVVLFTYFYTAITFDPQMIGENLQKSGAFIPGVRPGPSTVNYLGTIVTRITLVGALFLGIVAVVPLIVRNITGITSIAVGGTALLIVVSVVLDLLKKVEAQVSLKEY